MMLTFQLRLCDDLKKKSKTFLLFRAMVGAPKANSTVMQFGVIEPGVVHKCDIDSQDCEEVKFDTTGMLQLTIILTIIHFKLAF